MIEVCFRETKGTSSAYYARKRNERVEPEKHCAFCGATLHRRYNEDNGRFEDWNTFLKRRFCNRECSARYGLEKRKAEYDARFRPTSKEGLLVSADGEFRYKGIPKKVLKSTDRHGRKMTALLLFMEGGEKKSYKAAEFVAEVFLHKYKRGETYVGYKDGNLHNISLENLVLMSRKEHEQWRSRGLTPGRGTDTYTYQVEKLENVKTEVDAVLHYFKTKDISRVNDHVRDYLFPVMMDYCERTLSMGKYQAEELAVNTISRMYEVIASGHALYNLERYCKKISLNYRRKGTFGREGRVPKEIEILVNNINTDCLCNRYKVKRLK